MQLCYVDESGKAETLTREKVDLQPAFVIGGVSFSDDRLTEVTHRWIELKRTYQPSIAASRSSGWLDAILFEVKGTTLRRGYRSGGTRRQRKNARGFINGALRILEESDARLLSRIWIKKLDEEHQEMRIHSSSLQFICGAFHAGLEDDERGMVVVDSQTHRHNHLLAHSMFTQRFGKEPVHPKLVDMPVFGHSVNHAGLQIADLICSALLAPIACAVYAGRYDGWNLHCDSALLELRDEFGDRLAGLTYDWNNERTGREASTVVVDDPVGKRSTRLMWGPSEQSVRSGTSGSRRAASPPGGRPPRGPRERSRSTRVGSSRSKR